MSTYPDLDQLEGTKFVPFDTTDVQTSRGGERKVVEAFREDTTKQGTIGTFTVLHDVDATDRTTIETHYTDNRRGAFDFVDLSRPDITWQCLWGPAPQFDRLDHLGTRFTASITLWAKGNDE